MDHHPQPRLVRRVFISSTSLDLRAHRAAVHDTLERMGLAANDMAQFGARPSGDGTSVSLEEVATCDIYLLLVAWRYGAVPADAIKSITHQEYDEARRLHKPCFVYLAADATEQQDSPGDLFPAATRNPGYAAQLRAFRAELRQAHIIDTFTLPDDLARKVAAAHYRAFGLSPTGKRAPHDTPAAVRDFVGREQEVTNLSTLLCNQRSVAISAAVSGMAGVGKSALAGQVLRWLAAEPQAFPGGITWVRCHEREGIAGVAAVYDRLLAAWEAPLTPEELARIQSPEDAADAREQALRVRLCPPQGSLYAPALVLLDNVEVKLPLTRALATLNALGVTVLVASRHRPLLPGLTSVPLDVLDLIPAIELFTRRYAEANGTCDAESDPPLAKLIVERLGRLPLAIELAAVYAAFTEQCVAGLATQLEQADRLHPLNDPNDPTHSVRYAFEQSESNPFAAAATRLCGAGLTRWP
jgi:hypothetical protein